MEENNNLNDVGNGNSGNTNVNSTNSNSTSANNASTNNANVNNVNSTTANNTNVSNNNVNNSNITSNNMNMNNANYTNPNYNNANIYQGEPRIVFAQPQPQTIQIPEKYKPISAWGYFGYNLLFAIPIAGLILLIVFAFDDSNINRKNYARSYFCALLIIIIVLIILFGIIGIGITSFIGNSTRAWGL